MKPSRLSALLHPHHGAALVIAMLLTALGAAVATQMLSPMAGWLAREYAARDAQASYILADAATAWALTVLTGDRRFGPLDHYGELWATRLPLTAVEGGSIEGRITDLQSRFNLNSLVPGGIKNAANVALAKRFFTSIGLSENLVDMLADALDIDDITDNGQSERQRYGNPLRNSHLQRIADLRAVPGFSESTIRLLMKSDFIVILPQATPININTAERELLTVIFPQTPSESMDRALARRTQQAFSNSSDLTMLLGTNLSYDSAFGTGSQYFQVEAIIRFERTAHRVQLQIARPLSGPTHVLSRVISNV